MANTPNMRPVLVFQKTLKQYINIGREKIEQAAATLGFDIEILDKPDVSDPGNENVYIVLRPKTGEEG